MILSNRPASPQLQLALLFALPTLVVACGGGEHVASSRAADTQAGTVVSVQFVGQTPADEATVSGLVTFEVAASTAAPAAQIALVDFTGYFVATRPPFQFTVDTSQLPPGGNGYGFTAMAWDTAGNSSALVGTAIQVANPAAPTGVPPGVWLAQPQANAPVSGLVPLTVALSDSGAPITSVSYYAAGAYALPQGAGVPPVVLVGSSTVPPFSVQWDSTVGQTGFYALTAVATDANGSVGRTDPTVFYVENATATPFPPVVVMPNVAITTPADGAVVTGSFTVALAVDDPASTQATVYVDGAEIGVIGGPPPFQVTLDAAQWTNGVHALGASLVDSLGNIGESSVLNIAVQN